VLQVVAAGEGHLSMNGHGGPEEECIGGGICRRVVIDSVIDGPVDRERREEGEAVCDICQKGR
jgi:hypothetical protein